MDTIAQSKIRELISKWKPGEWHSLEDFRGCIRQSGLLKEDDYTITNSKEIHWEHKIRNCVQNWKKKAPKGCPKLSWDSKNHLYRVEVKSTKSLQQKSQIDLPDLFASSSLTKRLPDGLPLSGETFYSRSISPEGWLYVLKNPSWPEWVKIGITRDLSARLGTYNTGSPYEGVKYQYCHHTFHENARQIEKIIHDKLSDSQDDEQTNEWYKLSAEKAIQIIRDECRKNIE